MVAGAPHVDDMPPGGRARFYLALLPAGSGRTGFKGSLGNRGVFEVAAAGDGFVWRAVSHRSCRAVSAHLYVRSAFQPGIATDTTGR